MAKIVSMDRFGRILIPKEFRKIFGNNVKVLIERKNDSIVIRPVHERKKNIVEKIASYNISAEDWEEEIVEGVRSD